MIRVRHVCGDLTVGAYVVVVLTPQMSGEAGLELT